MDALTAAFTSHPRRFERFRWVYPVVSRRSGGLSLGVNLNPDRACNFDCPYCQVDRRGPAPSSEVDPVGLEAELRELLARVAATGLSESFPGVPPENRRLSDVALSGDGEPTLRKEFPEVCRGLAALRREWIASGGAPFRLVLITNATLLDRPATIQGLEFLCADGGGEIWGKLDAGTESWYREASASRVPLSRVVDNLAATVARFPLRIQTLFFEKDGRTPDDQEIEAWISRLEKIERSGRPLTIQLHTVARPTAVAGCRPLPLERLQEIASRVRLRTDLVVDVHAGIDSGAIGE